MRAYSVFEKFEKDSDPIEDMGIGLPAFWRKEYEKMGSSTTEIEYRKYFPKDFVSITASHEKIVNLLYGTLKYVTLNKLSPQKAFVKISVWCNIQYNYINEFEVRKMVADVLEKHFYMKVNPDFTLQEKFVKDSDPIKDMAIGLEHYRQKFKMYSVPSEYPSMTTDLKDLLSIVFNAPIHEVYFLGYLPDRSAGSNSYVTNPQKKLTLIQRLKDLTKDAKELYAHSIKNKFGNKIEVYDTEVGRIAAYHSDVNTGTYYFSDISAVIGLEEYV